MRVGIKLRFLGIASGILAVFTLLASMSCRAGSSGESTAPSKPNIVVIVTDDAGYIDFGAYGGTVIPTPNIDSIALGGVRFTSGYVTASVCAPSRAGLLTGRYQQRFGHEFNGPNEPVPGYSLEDMGLEPAELTIAEVLRELGYSTMAVGKWHMGIQDRFHPMKHGFEEFFGMLSGARSYFSIETDQLRSGHQLLRNETPVSESEVTYTTDMFSSEAVSYIGRNSDRPFSYISPTMRSTLRCTPRRKTCRRLQTSRMN